MEKGPPEPSVIVRTVGGQLYGWLYGRIAEGYETTTDDVRGRVEAGPHLSYDITSATYRYALGLNEKHLGELPADTLNKEMYVKQNEVHEKISYLLLKTIDALAQDEGL
jgi:hypothetical protein